MAAAALPVLHPAGSRRLGGRPAHIPTTVPDCSARAAALRHLGAADADLDALLAYTENPFDPSGPLTLGDEPFAAVWEAYLAEAEAEGVFPVLRRALVQLRFPVREGMSETAAYRAVTRRGDLSVLGPTGLFRGGLRLVAPERLRLTLHPTPAGRVPVLTAPVREDFVALVQALTRRNEPSPLPETMGALMVGGYSNWDRIHRARRAWEAGGEHGTWNEAFRAVTRQPEAYQDRFILLSEGPYSGLPAAEVGMGEAEWVRVSHGLRLEHECAHYYCRRALGAMRSNALDEVIADAYGLAAGAGGYDADRLRLFLEGHPGGPPGRVANYLGGLPPTAAPTVRRLVRRLAADLAAEPTLRQALPPDPATRAVALRRIVETVVEGWVDPSHAERQ